MKIKRCSNCSGYPCDDSDAMSLHENAETCDGYTSNVINDREYVIEDTDGDMVGYLNIAQSVDNFYYSVCNEIGDTKTDNIEIPIGFLDIPEWMSHINESLKSVFGLDDEMTTPQLTAISCELSTDTFYTTRGATGALDVKEQVKQINDTLIKSTAHLIDDIHALSYIPLDTIEKKHMLKQFITEMCAHMSFDDIESFIHDVCKREFGFARNSDLVGVVKYFKDVDRDKKNTLKQASVSIQSAHHDTLNFKQWNGVNIPDGYEIKNNRVNSVQYTENGAVLKPICNSSIVIKKTGNNTDDESYWVQVLFTDSFGDEHHVWIKQRDAFSRQGIMEIVNSGLNVTEGKAHELNAYLSDLLAINKETLTNELVVSTNGWKNNNSVFVSGECGYSNAGIRQVIHVDPDGQKGIDQSGDINAWYDGLKTILKYDIIRFKMYSVMAAPLLRILNQSSCVVDDAKESSEGKTFGCCVAMSLIGSPKQLMINGDTTKTAAEIKATQYNDHALFIDELGTQQNEEVLKALVYMIANEQGRGRANKDLTLRKTSTWKTIALTTGEAPITSHSSFTGQQVRVIELKCGLPGELSNDVNTGFRAIERNHGQIAPLFYSKIIENRELIHTLFEESKLLFADVTSNTGKRLSNTFACINVAGILLEEVFDDNGFETCDTVQIVRSVFKESVMETPIENYSIRALADIMDFIKRKESSFSIDGENAVNKHEFYGWITSDKIDIIPAVLRENLKKSNFDHARVLDDWNSKNIVKFSPNRRDFSVSHDGQVKKVIRLNYDIIKDII